MNIDIAFLSLFMAFTFGLIGIGYLMRFSIPISLFIFSAGGLLLALFISIDTITLDSFATSADAIFSYNVESFTGSSQLNLGGTIAQVEFASASNSQLVGDTINCIDLYMAKTGSPTGTANIGTFLNIAVPTIATSFGTIDVATLTTSREWHSFCLPTGDTYLIQSQDRLGVMYAGGNATNGLSLSSDSNNPFDGTVTFRQSNTGASWTSSTTVDQTSRFYLAGSDFEIVNRDMAFTQEIKVFMALMASMMLLVGAVVEYQSRRG